VRLDAGRRRESVASPRWCGRPTALALGEIGAFGGMVRVPSGTSTRPWSLDPKGSAPGARRRARRDPDTVGEDLVTIA